MILSDPAVERGVLSGICKYGAAAYYDVADILNDQSFTIDSNAVIYGCLKKILQEDDSKTIDIPSVLSAANELGLSSFFTNKNELQHLNSIFHFPVALNNVRKFAAKVRKLQIARMMYEQLEETKDKYLKIKGDEPISHILGIAEESIFNFTSLLNDQDDSPELVFGDLDKHLLDLAENPVDQIGISTGFPRYDFAIGGGLRKGTVNVIGARLKAQPLDAKILTPDGWKHMVEIRIGDVISSPLSQSGTTEVVGVYPQGVKSSYTFVFSDGKQTEASLDHYWLVRHHSWNQNDWRVMSYYEMENYDSNCGSWQFPQHGHWLDHVKYAGEKRMQCIKVANPDGLYVTDDYIVTHNTGKSFIGLNMGINIANNDIPVLIMDTEMIVNDQRNRAAAALAYNNNMRVNINDIETGKFGENEFTKNKLLEAAVKNKKVPLYHKNVGCVPFEDQLSIMRRWIARNVGLNDRGKANDCVIVYDYLKLTNSADLKTNDMKEYQLLGFMMTALHNFSLRYEVPILLFTQLNRDGITKETTDTASGSDRVLWLCSNFTIYKHKSDEEIEKDGEEHGNRKLVPVVARHGEGLEFGDYINVTMHGRYGKIIEGKTSFEIQKEKNQPTNEDVAF